MINKYKYYTKEDYLKYGSILETTEEIDARLKRHENAEKQNKQQAEQYRKEWAERINESRYYIKPERNINFIDDYKYYKNKKIV